jgi:hypothetical protein
MTSQTTTPKLNYVPPWKFQILSDWFPTVWCQGSPMLNVGGIHSNTSKKGNKNFLWSFLCDISVSKWHQMVRLLKDDTLVKTGKKASMLSRCIIPETSFDRLGKTVENFRLAYPYSRFELGTSRIRVWNVVTPRLLRAMSCYSPAPLSALITSLPRVYSICVV